MITYDPNGGDLGRADIKPITALEMQIIIPHVANILENLASTDLSKLSFKYAFEIHYREKNAAMFVIQNSTYYLPPNVFWYEIDGNMLFEIRGSSGGVLSAYICYLVTKEKK